MAQMTRTDLEIRSPNRAPTSRTSAVVHPAWERLMQYCADLGYGEIEKLRIQDGMPVMADIVREKVKFT